MGVVKLDRRRLAGVWLSAVAAELAAVISRAQAVVFALVVGALLLLLAIVYVTPADRDILHGEMFAELSQDPLSFGASNLMRFRLLTPLVAYWLGVPKDLFFMVPWAAACLFLATVYAYFERQRYSFWERLGMAAMMAFSIPTFLTLYWRGFTDATSLWLLTLCLIFIRWFWLWPVLYWLALLDHERGLLAAPWLVWWANMRGFQMRRLLWAVGLVGAAVLGLLLVREIVRYHGGQSVWDLAFYLSGQRVRENFEVIRGRFLLGTFASFRLFWFWPLYAMYRYWGRAGGRRMVFFLLLVLASAAVQVIVAHDVTRLMGLAFPAILLGADAVRQLWGPAVFRRRLWWLIGLNFLLPNYMVYFYHVVPFYPLPLSLFYKYFTHFNPWAAWL